MWVPLPNRDTDISPPREMECSISHVSDYRAPDTSGPDQWLELRKDALEWIAAKRENWWHREDADGNLKLNLLRISADAGLDDAQIYRFQAAAQKGERVTYKADTIAALVSLGAAERGVSDATAFNRIFLVRKAPQAQAVAA